MSYNIFCYADDILLASLTVSGLQRLIDKSNTYIINHGLLFNPKKTICSMFGSCPFVVQPSWYITNTALKVSDSIDHLGVALSNNIDNDKLHISNRISACRKAYYAMQGAGMGNLKNNPDAVAYLWKTALRPRLTYGLNTMFVTKKSIELLDKLQSRLIKTCLGLHKFCKSTPILRALHVPTITETIEASNLQLLRSILHNSSRAKIFYTYLITNTNSPNTRLAHHNLVSRCYQICSKYDVPFLKFVFGDNSALKCIKSSRCHVDGLADSVSYLLHSGGHDDLLKLLLKAF